MFLIYKINKNKMLEVHKTPDKILSNDIDYYVENLDRKKPTKNFLDNYFFNILINCQSCYRKLWRLNSPDFVRKKILRAEENAGSLTDNREFAEYTMELCKKCEKANFPFPAIHTLLDRILNL